jgi:hypothetical protein
MLKDSWRGGFIVFIDDLLSEPGVSRQVFEAYFLNILQTNATLFKRVELAIKIPVEYTRNPS